MRDLTMWCIRKTGQLSCGLGGMDGESRDRTGVSIPVLWARTATDGAEKAGQRERHEEVKFIRLEDRNWEWGRARTRGGIKGDQAWPKLRDPVLYMSSWNRCA